MLTKTEEHIIRDLRLDFKIKWMEEIMKQFITESLEAVLESSNRSHSFEQPFLTIGEIAKKFKVSKATIHNWIRRGIVSGHKVGKNRYFTEAELRDVMKFLKQ